MVLLVRRLISRGVRFSAGIGFVIPDATSGAGLVCSGAASNPETPPIDAGSTFETDCLCAGLMNCATFAWMRLMASRASLG